MDWEWEKKDEFEHDIDYVVRYGVGDRKNFAGDLYIRKENIILIFVFLP